MASNRIELWKFSASVLDVGRKNYNKIDKRQNMYRFLYI